MKAHAIAYSVFVAVCLTTSASAQAERSALDFVRVDAAAALVINDVSDLKKQGDALLAEAKWQNPLRPSQIFDQLLASLGVTKGLDDQGSAAIVLYSPDKVGEKGWENIQNFVVLALPVGDVDKLGSCFRIPTGSLKPGKVVEGKSNWFGKQYMLSGKHLLVADDVRALRRAAEGKALITTLSKEDRKQIESSHLSLVLGTKTWGDGWKSSVDYLRKRLDESTDHIGRDVAKGLGDCFESLRVGIITLRVASGLDSHFIAIMDDAISQDAAALLGKLRPSVGADRFVGFPPQIPLAAQAFRGSGLEMAAIVRFIAREFSFTSIFGPPTDKRWVEWERWSRNGLFREVFLELGSQITGSQVAVYHNAGKDQLGLMQMLAVLETDNPEALLAEMKKLAGYTSVGLSTSQNSTQASQEEIERLVRELGDTRFRVRQSASTKLLLIGEPAILSIDAAKKSSDPEIRRRAEELQRTIANDAVELRREALRPENEQTPRPRLRFEPMPTQRGGIAVETIVVSYPDHQKGQARLLQDRFGPQGGIIRLVAQPKRLVAYWGSDESVLLRFIKGENNARITELPLKTFRSRAHPGRQGELHFSVGLLTDLGAAVDLRDPKANAPEKALTSAAVTFGERTLQLDWWLPKEELAYWVKGLGW